MSASSREIPPERATSSCISERADLRRDVGRGWLAGRETVTRGRCRRSPFHRHGYGPGPDAANYIRRHVEARGHTPRIERQSVTREIAPAHRLERERRDNRREHGDGLGFPDGSFARSRVPWSEFSAAHPSASTNPSSGIFRIWRAASERDESWFASHRPYVLPPAARSSRRAFAKPFPIRRNEALQHGHDEVGWIDDGWPCLAGQHFGIGDKVAMQRRRQLHRDLTGLSSAMGPSFSLVINICAP